MSKGSKGLRSPFESRHFHWPCDATLPPSRPWPVSFSPVQRLMFHVHCVPGIVQVLLEARVRFAGCAKVQGPGGIRGRRRLAGSS